MADSQNGKDSHSLTNLLLPYTTHHHIGAEQTGGKRDKKESEKWDLFAAFILIWLQTTFFYVIIAAFARRVWAPPLPVWVWCCFHLHPGATAALLMVTNTILQWNFRLTFSLTPLRCWSMMVNKTRNSLLSCEVQSFLIKPCFRLHDSSPPSSDVCFTLLGFFSILQLLLFAAHLRRFISHYTHNTSFTWWKFYSLAGNCNVYDEKRMKQLKSALA